MKAGILFEGKAGFFGVRLLEGFLDALLQGHHVDGRLLTHLNYYTTKRIKDDYIAYVIECRITLPQCLHLNREKYPAST